MDGPVVLMAEVGYFVGVGGDNDAVELGAGTGGLEDPCQHWFACYGAKDFTGQARGGEARGDDAEDSGGDLSSGLGIRLRIKYDGSWLCRGDVSFLERVLCRHNPFQHIGGVAQMVRATDS